MDMHRLQTLDGHICVLRNLQRMISKELDNLTEERQRIAQNVGLTDSDERGSVNDHLIPWTLCDGPHCTVNDESRRKGSDRSISPASPLDSSGVAYDDYVGAANDNHAAGAQLLGELSTPREAPCLEDADPDMNNLSDSEEERYRNDSTYSVASRQLTEMAGMSQGDDAKVPRSPSSLNNAESDSDVEEEDATKPCWISNSIYVSNVIDMVLSQEMEETISETPSFLKPGRIAERFLSNEEEASTSLRSFDAWLIQKASAANRLTNDLERMKKELLFREDIINLHWEKYRRLKLASKEEINRSRKEVDDLRHQRDEASSAKFIMFCKLQAAEERVCELEKKLKSLPSTSEPSSNDGKKMPASKGMVLLQVHAQGRPRSQTPSFDFTHHAENVDCQNLQTSLKDAYKSLIKEKKTGDQLRSRLQELEKREKKVTASASSTGIKAKANSGSKLTKTAAVTPNKRPGRDNKKLKLDLSRVQHLPVQKEAALVRGASRARHDRDRSTSRASRSKRW